MRFGGAGRYGKSATTCTGSFSRTAESSRPIEPPPSFAKLRVRLGATLRANSPVTHISTEGAEIAVEAGGERYRAGSLVLAAASWTPHMLAHFNLRVPMEVTKEQVIYFKPRDLAGFAMGKFPIWIWMDDPSFYGFPEFGEAATVKITQDAGGKPVDPDTRGFEEDAELTARVSGFVERYLPAHLARCSGSRRACTH